MRKKDRLYTANKWNQPLFNRYNWGGLAIADKVANPWNYADDVDVTKQYMNSKNAFGISKADNPFSKGNLQAAFSKQGLGNALKGASSGLITTGAGLVGGLLNKGISGGLSSAAGNTISSLGTTIGGTVAMANPLIGAAIIGASNLIGGTVNNLWGSKLNQENINKVNQVNEGLANTTSALGQASDAGSYISSLTGTDFSSDFSDSFIGEDGVFASKAADKAAELRAQREQNLIALNDAATYNANRLNDASEARAFRNYIGAAFGGKLNKKEHIKDISNTMNILYNDEPLFAFGGNLQTHGSDWPTGLTHIDAGGSHESNPNEGVQMGVDPEGTPNLVEEGEVVFNDYVYSNRIKLDAEAKKAFRFGKKQDITYAEAAKKLEKEISERPNDPISKAGFKAQMEELAQHQERQKQEMEAERAKEAFEALSPEEQVAIMQQAQQQKQMTQEEALQQQGMQQLSPEEAAMMQEQQMAQQAPSEEELFAAQAANVAANGGLLVKATDVEPNKFAYSGRMRRRAIKKYNNDWFLTQARSLGLLGDNDDVISVTDGDGKVHKFEYNPKDPELNLSTFNNIYREYQKKKALDTYIKGKRQAKRNELFGDKGLYSFSDNKEKIYKNRVGEKDRVGYINSSYTGDLVNDTYDGFISTEEYNKLVDKYNKLKDDKNAKSADVENLRNKLAGYKPINEKAGDFMYDYNGKIIRDLQDGVTEDSILDAYNEDYKKGFEWDGKNAAALNYPAELTHSGTSYLRYAPALGGMIGLINDVTSNPDYNRAQSIINGSKINTPYISAPVLGDYMTYRPMDIWSKQYALDANARATDRSITNNAAPIGTKIAGKLANNYNNQIASGNLYRNALEYNDALLEKVKNFNRTTNQINAAMNMSAQEANQRAFMHNNEQAFKGLLYGNQMMEDIDNRRNASMNANLTNLLTSIGNIGEEAYDEDRLKWLENTGVLKSNVFSAAKGGKLKRKKNKRGLTF